ncbi:carbohydrate ABC transporter permease [Kaistia dalseonensis]|uniref:Multiple sugar transport system permease protein n=1 Tax=Kaistia dalseonensis TaxID=410840 RepID=A0ABU0H6X6_9HYPH|nr:carbohydrate ABC transporter permease [Kaistia dalseonensis]MCX5495456.1 carbohydrate ABC transporter permease [Kaistia dalseonensis]MDQ0438046.1 multiple sugar transport system permease protein [Kaistia dalseonensis]
MNEERTAGSLALYGILTLVAAVMLLPFAWVFFGAFKSQAEILAAPGAWLPESFTDFSNFVELFTHRQFGTYLGNSLIVSTLTVVSNLFFSALAGYALAKIPFRGRGFVFGCIIAAMMIPYIALFVPSFFIIVQMGLLNTLFAIFLPIAVMPIGVFIMRQFALSVPNELLEAARLDGAGEFRIFFTIFLPLVGPALATVAIITFLNSWNYFLWPLIVAQNQDIFTLPVGLAVASQGAKSTEFGLLLSGAIIVLLPVLVLFLFLQRYFVRGIAATGLK